MSSLSINQYQRSAEKTSGAYGTEVGDERRVMLAILGLCGESGELANKIKKLTAHGHLITVDELQEELGDVLWYLSEATTALGFSLNEVAELNIEKLMARYQGKFTKEKSINRLS
jgi:NTP pyrophosphatase (non-canonical NTP hydrolase)